LIAKLLYLQIWLHTPCYAAVSLFCNIPFRQISPHGSKLKNLSNPLQSILSGTALMPDEKLPMIWPCSRRSALE